MTVQIAAVTHAVSGIQQALFVDRDRLTGARVFYAQATFQRDTRTIPMDLATVLEWLDAWATLRAEDMLTKVSSDAITMRSLGRDPL